MLPFIKPKKQDAGIATVYRAPDEDKIKDESDEHEGLEMVAEDLLKAIHSHDKKLLISALQSVFEILDSMPHVEGPHEQE